MIRDLLRYTDDKTVRQRLRWARNAKAYRKRYGYAKPCSPLPLFRTGPRLQRCGRGIGIRDRKVPYIIGIAGSAAVGKSTTARVLQALLARWSPRPKVDLVTIDGFLYPKAALEREGLLQKKGFPESYDRALLLSFLSGKAGRSPVRAPV